MGNELEVYKWLKHRRLCQRDRWWWWWWWSSSRVVAAVCAEWLGFCLLSCPVVCMAIISSTQRRQQTLVRGWLQHFAGATAAAVVAVAVAAAVVGYDGMTADMLSAAAARCRRCRSSMRWLWWWWWLSTAQISAFEVALLFYVLLLLLLSQVALIHSQDAIFPEQWAEWTVWVRLL